MSATATQDSGIFRLPAAWPLPAEPPAAVKAEVDAMAALLAAWPEQDVDLGQLAVQLSAEVRALLED